jgi:hypothetical protein
MSKFVKTIVEIMKNTEINKSPYMEYASSASLAARRHVSFWPVQSAGLEIALALDTFVKNASRLRSPRADHANPPNNSHWRLCGKKKYEKGTKPESKMQKNKIKMLTSLIIIVFVVMNKTPISSIYNDNISRKRHTQMIKLTQEVAE